MEMKKVGAPALDKVVLDRLLDLLSTDDAFRALFVSDARAALEVAGYVPLNSDPMLAHPGGCMEVDVLASKAAIAAAREKLTETWSNIFGFGAPAELRGA